MYQTLSSPISSGTLRAGSVGAEVLVHGVEAGQELGEPLRPDRDDQRGADRGVDGVAAADPVPEAEGVGGVDPEVGDLVERGRDRDEVLGDRVRSSSAAPASPSSSQALHSRALVSVSSVPKVLLETMNSVVAGSRPASVVAASVGSMLLMNRHSRPVLAVRRQRLVGHHRAEVGAADADVDDRADPLAGDAGPRAAADLVGEGVDPAEHLVDVGDDVLAVDLERWRRRAAAARCAAPRGPR